MSNDQRQAWFARVMESGLENDIFAPSDVLAHATPDVLANHLPADLLSKVLAASLAAGSMTPERVLETVTPEPLAKHPPPGGRGAGAAREAPAARGALAVHCRGRRARGRQQDGGLVNLKAFYVATLSS